jgi:hypothetical protein
LPQSCQDSPRRRQAAANALDFRVKFADNLAII